MLLHSCGQMTVEDEGLDSKSIEEASGTTDTTAPTVSSTSPSDGATTVVSSISATFSELMDNATITSSTFTLVDNSSNAVSGTVSITDNTTSNITTATFTPSSTLSRSTQYIATLSTGMKDLNGNALSSQNTISFTPPLTQQLGTSTYDYAQGIATDSSGNLYVTGYTSGGLDGNTNSGGSDIFLVKYYDNGTKHWTSQLGTSSNDQAYAVSTDSSGNVYVAGATNGGLDGTNAGYNDLFVVKYNSSGTKQWTKQLGTSWEDKATGVTVDSSGNVYVTGTTEGNLDGNSNSGCGPFTCVPPGYQDLFLVKYNSSGNKQWTKQLGASGYHDSVGGISMDSSGNIYVAGGTGGDLDGNNNAKDCNLWCTTDLFVVKYYDNGTKHWTKQMGTLESEKANGVANDSSGNLYVTGYTSGGLDGNTNSGGGDIFLVKYYDNGTKQWTKQLGTSSYDTGNEVTVDSSGNVYVTGYTQGGLDGTNAGNSDLFVVKYNSSGTKQWTKQLGTSSNDYAYGIATDSSGNVYLTGNTEGELDGNTNSGNSDIFLLKYNSSGTKQ